MRGGADREVVVYRRPGCPFCVLLTVQLRVAHGWRMGGAGYPPGYSWTG